MTDAYIIDAVRTPIGRYGGALAPVRADDLAAVPLSALQVRNPGVDFSQVDDLLMGCANQAGEDNRNVARMAALLSGLPIEVPGTTVNRLCGSGMDAVSMAARAIKSDEADMVIAGGVESMSRAPFVLPKASSAFTRQNSIYDTTLGWRFVNPLMQSKYGIDSMPETAENLACEYKISRQAQDRFALRSQQKTMRAQQQGVFDAEMTAVHVPQRKDKPLVVNADEHPRHDSSMESLSRLAPVVHVDGTVTAGNASGVNDGACALMLANESMAKRFSLAPKARVVAAAAAGVEPRIMGIGPVPAAHKVLSRAGLKIKDMDVIELNEAFAAQALAVLSELDVDHEAEHVNPNGGAIALGHPLGMSGARLVSTAVYELQRRGARYALCMMCIGVGQGVALILENVNR